MVLPQFYSIKVSGHLPPSAILGLPRCPLPRVHHFTFDQRTYFAFCGLTLEKLYADISSPQRTVGMDL